MPVLRLPSIDGGLNISDLEHKIGDNQSPDMCNMWFRDRTLSKRWGQEKPSFTLNGNPAALGVIYAISKEFEGYVCIHAGTSLYKWDTAANILTDLLEDYGFAAAAASGVFAEFNGNLNYFDGENIWVIDSSWVAKKVVSKLSSPEAEGEIEAHIPLVYINCAPDLSSSDAVDAYNLVGAGFEVHYNGGGNIQTNYLASNVAADTFTITDTEGKAVTLTSAGTAGWKVRKTGGEWKTAAASSSTITSAGHGYSNGDKLQFKSDTGKVPDGIMEYNFNVVSEYHLPLGNLDSTAIIVAVNDDTMDLSHYSWNAASGIVTFGEGYEPPAGTNNVCITAYKTIPGGKSKIAGCRIAVPFGGESGDIEGGSRLFVMGNPSYPRTYWYSDLGASQSRGVAYWPDDQYEELNQNNDAITAAGKQAGNLIVLKEKSLFAIAYNFDGQEVYYPVREFNSTVGCDIPGSVQLIDNNLVFANTYGGVFMIINTSGSAEENVKPISGNVNGTGISRGLLDETGLRSAKSIDYDRKYWLCVNNYVYLWDYDLTPFILAQDSLKSQRRLAWFKLSNINAKHWLGNTAANDTGLWYSDGTDIVHFIYYFNDFGKGIDAWWKSKSFDFGQPMYQKLVRYAAVSIRADSNSKMTVTVSNEKKTALYSKNISILSFSWVLSDWTTFTWSVQRFSKPYRLMPKMKRKYYCQIWVTGDVTNRDMGITDLEITYDYGKMVK